MADGGGACHQPEGGLGRKPLRYALHDAVEAGDATELARLLQLEDEDVYDPSNPDGGLSLDRNERDNHGCTPLHVAALYASLPCFKLLLSRGVRVNVKCNGSPLLHVLFSMAAIPGNVPFVEAALGLLVTSNVDLSSTDDEGRTWLHMAAGVGLVHLAEIVRGSAKHAANPTPVDGQDKFGRTPLHLAAAGRRDAAVRWLVDACGASAAVVDGRGNVAAHAAARAGWAAGVALLTDAYYTSAAAAAAASAATAAACAASGDVGGEGATPAVPSDGDAAAAASSGAPPATPAALPVPSRASLPPPVNWCGLTPEEALVPHRNHDDHDGDEEATAASSGDDAAMAGTTTAAAGGGGGGVVAPAAPSTAAGSSPRTLVVAPGVCLHHHTTAYPLTRRSGGVPPENTGRLDTLTNSVNGTLRATGIVDRSTWVGDAPRAAISDVLRVHEYQYIRRIMVAVGGLHNPPATAAGATTTTTTTPVEPPSACCTPAQAATGEVHVLDGDTAVSSQSWEAALTAAGAVCAAVDAVVSGAAPNAFCAVRPPGHHAGPRGIVTNGNDCDGSHGFCLVNNVAVGAAYARATYGRPVGAYGAALAAAGGGGGSGASSSAAGPTAQAPPPSSIKRVAIFDFDVHHGNGTEAIIRNTVPTETVAAITTPFATGAISTMSYKPWLDIGDGGDTLFISSHGFGKRDPEHPAAPGWFYPGSGAPSGFDASALDRLATAAKAEAAAAMTEAAAAAVDTAATAPAAGGGCTAAGDAVIAGTAAASVASTALWPAPFELGAVGSSASGAAGAVIPPLTVHGTTSDVSFQSLPVPEPLLEAHMTHPHIINVGMPHPAAAAAAGASSSSSSSAASSITSARQWRRIMTLEVLPRLAAFKPDLILVSAGFDAHTKDSINLGYVGLREDDYAWITTQLVKVANACCGGRIVSVLEGGYKIQGRVVSAFGRSVAAHVGALCSGVTEKWDTGRERALLLTEMRSEHMAKAAAAAAAAATAGAPGSGSAAALASPSGVALPFMTPRFARGSSTTSTYSTAPASASDATTPRPAARSATLRADSDASGVSVASSVSFALADAAPPLAATATPAPLASGGRTSAAHQQQVVAGAAAILASPTGAAPHQQLAASAGGGEATASRSSKRKRAAVDYSALDARLRAEETGSALASGGAAAPSTPASGSSASTVTAGAAASSSGSGSMAAPTPHPTRESSAASGGSGEAAEGEAEHGPPAAKRVKLEEA